MRAQRVRYSQGLTQAEFSNMTVESGPLPDNLRGGSIVTVIRPPIDKLARYLTVSTLFQRDGKLWYLGSHDVEVSQIFVGNTGGGHVIAEHRLEAHNPS